MGIGALNSPVTQGGYANKEMLDIWSVRTQLQSLLDVEVAMAKTQAELGTIPLNAAQEIEENAVCSDDLFQKVLAGKAGHPLVAILDAIRSELPDDAVGWVHFGATSQDILDTGRALQIKKSLELLSQNLSSLQKNVRSLAGKYSETLMVARTNGQNALPTTLGMRFARWASELERSRQRITDGTPRWTMVQFSGAVGTYAAMGKDGMRVAQGVAKKLGLTFEAVPWHASSDTMCEMCVDVAILGRSIQKMAEDLFEMQETEFREAAEPMNAHTSGSSTMPQKLNPFSTMKIDSGAQMASGLAASLLMSSPATFERDARQLEIIRNAIPQVFSLVQGCVVHMDSLLERMQFKEERLRENVSQEGVLLLSEHIMMEMAPRLGQARAHDILQAFAKENRSTGIGLRDYLEKADVPHDVLEDVDWDSLCDPSTYLGLSREISKKVSDGSLS